MAMSEADLMHTISGNIRSLMEETGYSRKDLSRDTGIPESSISYYIRGRKLPGVKAIFNLCMAFNCELEDILGYVDYVE